MRTDILSKRREILLWIAKGHPNAEIARRLSCKVDTLKSYYQKLGIDYSGNQGAKGHKHSPYKKGVMGYIDNPNISNARKRRGLIEEGIKEGKCEVCGLSEWMGKPIPLELHHKDLNHYNNSLDNLQILCANCHMQAHNYCNTRKINEK